MNRPGPDGRDQLVALTEAGFIRRAGDDGHPLPPFDAASAAREPRIADPTDEGRPLEERARAYLHANCGHCHSDHGGGSVPLRLQVPRPGRRDARDRHPPHRGDFGLPDARIIKPGDPYTSTLYFRMAKFGRDRMPHIGSERPDEAGLDLIARWIAGMGWGRARRRAQAPKAGRVRAVAGADPRSAQLLARKLGRGELGAAERDELLAAAAKLPNGPIRDLFEGFLPSDDRGASEARLEPPARGHPGPRRRPRPGREAVLVAGDPVRDLPPSRRSGHAGRAGPVGDRQAPPARGPPRQPFGALAADRAEICYLCRIDDGRDLASPGLLVGRDEGRVILRDVQGKEVVLAAKDVEELRPSRVSMMPDGQLADLTAQEAADLVEYLASLR